MKWIDGYTWQEKKKRREEWHEWFAWFPVTVGVTNDHRKIKVWGQIVMRRGHFFSNVSDSGWDYIYKEKSEWEKEVAQFKKQANGEEPRFVP